MRERRRERNRDFHYQNNISKGIIQSTTVSQMPTHSKSRAMPTARRNVNPRGGRIYNNGNGDSNGGGGGGGGGAYDDNDDDNDDDRLKSARHRKKRSSTSSTINNVRRVKNQTQESFRRASTISPCEKKSDQFFNHSDGIKIMHKDRTILKYEKLIRTSQQSDEEDQGRGQGRGQDPLQHWVGYIEYMKQTYPSNKTVLFHTYQKCVESCIQKQRYKSDQRFVHICVLYADKCPDPLKLQQFEEFYKQKVGVKMALLYMTWAWVAEKMGEYKYVEVLFQKALDKKAEPVRAVKHRYEQFQRRMKRRNDEMSSLGTCKRNLKHADSSSDTNNDNVDVDIAIERNGITRKKKETELVLQVLNEDIKEDQIDLLRTPSKKNGHSNVVRVSPRLARSLSSTKQKKMDWVPARLVDITSSRSHNSPYISRVMNTSTPRHTCDGSGSRSQRKRNCQKESTRRPVFGFKKNLVAGYGIGGETCFEREKARMKLASNCLVPGQRGGRNFNHLSKHQLPSPNSYISIPSDAYEEEGGGMEILDYDYLHQLDTERALEVLSKGGWEGKGGDEVHLNLNECIPRSLTRLSKTRKEFELNGNDHKVLHKLGSGCFGTVLLCESLNSAKGAEISKNFALKVQKPTGCLAWEFLVLQKLQRRLNKQYVGRDIAILGVHSLTLFQDGAVMQMTAGSQSGFNLLDIVNFHKGNVPELIAIHYTQRMLVLMEMLHVRGKVVHCDVKPDNWIVSGDIISGDVMLVDFGRAKDLGSLSNDTVAKQFQGKVATAGLECIAMRNGSPWCFDIDTYGLCVCAHTLLFGNYMEVIQASGKDDTRWKIKNRLRRYWQTPLWSFFFDCLINNSTCEFGEYRENMRSIRQAFEAHIKSRAEELRQLLLNQATMLPKRKNT